MLHFIVVIGALAAMIMLLVQHLTPIYYNIRDATPFDPALMQHYYSLGLVAVLYGVQCAAVAFIIAKKRTATVRIVFKRVVARQAVVEGQIADEQPGAPSYALLEERGLASLENRNSIHDIV